MIDKLILNFGTSFGSSSLEIEIAPITVFLGPNGSGKSEVLREIHRMISNPRTIPTRVLKKIVLSKWSKEDVEYEMSKMNIQDSEHSISETIDGRMVNSHKKLSLILKNPESAFGPIEVEVAKSYIENLTLKLDGSSRLSLVNSQPMSSLQQKPSNYLDYLFRDDTVRKELRSILFEAFGQYFVIDPTTSIGKLYAQFSDREPIDEAEERSFTDAAIKFHKNATYLESASDGVKAYCGILIALKASEPKLILIDEPEAFLHPALANKLGKEIGHSIQHPQKRLIVATHSPSFLMGCIHSRVALNIVRLTYKSGVSTARLLPKDKILRLMRNPMLRSTGILQGLFYNAVIVTKADADRAFYAEINERLLTVGDPRGIPNCLFVNAQNKQTLWDIVAPLRELGIPTVGIADIDLLKDEGGVFAKPLKGAFVPFVNHAPFKLQRVEIYKLLVESGKDMKRDGGIDILSSSDREGANDFLDVLASYGIMVVRNGELEYWLKYLGVKAQKSRWLEQIFEKMGENPSDEAYVNPSTGDVWDFIGSIKHWINNPNRKGIPKE